MIKIRKSTMDDLPRMEEIFAYAREQMKKNGNPNQWGDHKPTRDMLMDDIEKQISYVLTDEERIFGTFVFFIGEDPTYGVIEEGAWLNNDTYGVIHRVASDGSRKGMMALVADYAKAQCANVRIDTHHDNHIMQRAVTKQGFKQAGIIYLENGDPRIAYHYAAQMNNQQEKEHE
jgi:hypothetical protein